MLQLVILLLIAKVFNTNYYQGLYDTDLNRLYILEPEKRTQISQNTGLRQVFVYKNLLSGRIEKHIRNEVKLNYPYVLSSDNPIINIEVFDSCYCFNYISKCQKLNLQNNTQQTNQKNSLEDIACVFCFKEKVRGLFYEKNSNYYNQQTKSLLLNDNKLKIFLFILHSSICFKLNTDLADKFFNENYYDHATALFYEYSYVYKLFKDAFLSLLNENLKYLNQFAKKEFEIEFLTNCNTLTNDVYLIIDFVLINYTSIECIKEIYLKFKKLLNLKRNCTMEMKNFKNFDVYYMNFMILFSVCDFDYDVSIKILRLRSLNLKTNTIETYFTYLKQYQESTKIKPLIETKLNEMDVFFENKLSINKWRK
ncbi:hypothetical protein GVAV_001778 [Gurleya vavrai]